MQREYIRKPLYIQHEFYQAVDIDPHPFRFLIQNKWRQAPVIVALCSFDFSITLD